MAHPDVIDERIRSAATADEEQVDQIGYDTPRSGVATPQPDLHDKRLPGITSYFNQVGPASIRRLLSGPFTSTGKTASSAPSSETQPEEPRQTAGPPQPAVSTMVVATQNPPSLSHESAGSGMKKSSSRGKILHPYPTPPSSHPPSLRSADSGSDGEARSDVHLVARSEIQHNSSAFFQTHGRRGSACLPVTGVTQRSVLDGRHMKNPPERNVPKVSSPSARSQSTPGWENEGGATVRPSTSFLQKLTNVMAFKSGQSTPTRSLSTAGPPRADSQGDVARASSSNIDRASTLTPTPPGTQLPAPKGKLTIKIPEARGLRKSRDPYVVAVFQRSELISGGPRAEEIDDDTAIANVAMGGVPIQRSGSDAGRPMAIPMRSRQSSNTSITDYNTFRNRTTRKSLTNPKWDAEAIL
jgi:serine/threonine protein kinase SCH9